MLLRSSKGWRACGSWGGLWLVCLWLVASDPVTASAVATPPRLGVRVAVAANFQATLAEIIAQYSEPQRIAFTAGATGALVTQILRGAPFDILLAADALRPQALVAGGFVLPGDSRAYALGRLAIVPPPHASNQHQMPRPGLPALTAWQPQRLGVANPMHAPYGAAALTALQRLGIYDGLKERLVFGQNVGQVAAFLHSGSISHGVISLSQALVSGQPYWAIPTELYQPIRQGAVLLKASRAREEVRDFWLFLATPKVRAIIKKSGYSLPENDKMTH